VVKSRRVFCQIAVKKMGYSGADVARFLGINTSAVNRLAVSDELPEVAKYFYIKDVRRIEGTQRIQYLMSKDHSIT